MFYKIFFVSRYIYALEKFIIRFVQSLVQLEILPFCCLGRNMLKEVGQYHGY